LRRYVAISSVLEKRPVSIGSVHANVGLRARRECLTRLFGPEAGFREIWSNLMVDGQMVRRHRRS
jgi:hypothetical protein